MNRPHARFVVLSLLAALSVAGCSRETAPPKSVDREVSAGAAEDQAPAASEQDENGRSGQPESTAPVAAIPTAEQIGEAIRKANPDFRGDVSASMGPQGIEIVLSDPAIEDISPLRGLPLVALGLQGCHVTDIDALEGMQLQLIDLSHTGVSNIDALAGMPLTKAYFENTRIKDISALAGAPLQELYLSQTPVEDIGPLKGAPLENLNLVDSRVEDLSPLAGGRLKMVWLNNTPVRDCSPLASNPVVSVTLAGTKISDIGPFKGHPTLERLHIARSDVTDLTPLQWMNGLTRLIFTPSRIEKGIEYARNMPSIREIGTAFGTPDVPEQRFPPEVFWEMYDAGKFD